MKYLSCIPFVIFFLFSCSNDNGNTEEPEPPSDFTYEFTKFQYTHSYNDTDTVIPYHLFEPQGVENANTTFPLVVSLHGTEYHSVAEEDFLSVFPSNYMATSWIEERNQTKYPSYVIAPNLHNQIWDITGYRSWDDHAAQDFLNELIDSLINTYPIDVNKIYFVGHSIGGGAVWKLSQALKNKTAAIIPLSQALMETESSTIIEDISNGVYDDISIWTIVHVSDQEGSIRTSRPIFQHLQNNNYNPVITNTLDSQVFDLTSTQIEAEIDAGKNYFYTENTAPCDNVGGCHYSWINQFEGDLIYEWLFKQQKND